MPRSPAPLGFVLILAMVVVPLPPLALDILFTFNICFGLMILLAALYTAKPTDFSSFPTLLLMTTLLRLSLNVAAARVILLDGYQGADAAGRVIESFGAFVIGGNYAVGIAVFAILVIINFVVITKGAGRIAEVAARFVLDGMPGKQMAIDADLNAGLINQEEATHGAARKSAREADFFGAMDGASKFVRGDAVAAVLILFINLIGGLIIGVWQHELSIGRGGQTYTLLTIGDGLVAQIPALVISSAAGIVVSRGHDRRRCRQPDRSRSSRSFRKPGGSPPASSACSAWFRACRICRFCVFAGAARRRPGVVDRARAGARRAAPPPPPPPPRRSRPRSISASSSWSSRWKSRSAIVSSAWSARSATAGCCAACARCAARCRANSAFSCRSCMSATIPICARPAIASWSTASSAPPARCIPTGCWRCRRARCWREIQGLLTRDPVFGRPAHWIMPAPADQARAARLHRVRRGGGHRHAFRARRARSYRDACSAAPSSTRCSAISNKLIPKLVEELTPKLLPLTAVHTVLSGLLAEQVPIRDLRTIVGALIEGAATTQEPRALHEIVRLKLGGFIVQTVFGAVEELKVDGARARARTPVAGGACGCRPAPARSASSRGLPANCAPPAAAAATRLEAAGSGRGADHAARAARPGGAVAAPGAAARSGSSPTPRSRRKSA